MPTRTARTAWNGSLEDGSGQTELSSSKLATFDVSFPRRSAEDAEGVTSPEELIAAALTSCYAMQLSALLGEEGHAPDALDVSATVGLAPDPAGGFQIPQVELTVRGEVAGIDADTFARVAKAAKETCPVSKALAGTTITLDATLEQ